MNAIDWQGVIELLGGGTVVLGAAAWLIKSLVTHGLSRDVEKFKITLESEADAEIESLKSSLQIAATEHQIRFSKLHERRAEVIAELYTKLVELFWEGQSFTQTGGRNQSDDGEAFSRMRKMIRDFIFLYDTRRIYLSADSCLALSHLVDLVSKAISAVGVYGPIADPMSEKIRQEKIAALMNSVEAFETTIPEAKRVLEKEFRTLLGVTEQRDRSSTKSETSRASTRA